MPSWHLAYVLPNMQAPLTVNSFDGHLAFASYDDPRLLSLRASTAGVAKLMDGFEDSYGNKQTPSAFIWLDSIPKKRFSMKSFVDFRNAIAMASILPAWTAIDPTTPVTPSNPQWSGPFHFYPAQLGANGAIHFMNPALQIFGGAGAPFRGMLNPAIPVYRDKFGLDWPLLAHLLQAWDERYIKTRTSWVEHEALFRSLEMAYRALDLPIWNAGGRDDFGTSLGLWISALEILAHPRKGDVTRAHVLDLLSMAKWQDARLRYRRFKVRNRRRTFAERLCDAMYQSRNAFLHGNRVYVDHWRLSKNGLKTAIGNLAPLVYRTALMSFVGWDLDATLAGKMAGIATLDGVTISDPLDALITSWTNDLYENTLRKFL